VADPTLTPPPPTGVPSYSIRGWFAPYRALLGSRVRSQTAYRRSFILDLVGSTGMTVIGFVEIYVIFTNLTVLGGVDFNAALAIYALAHLSFSLADMLVGHLDTLPTYVRAGTLDAFLLRPLPVLAQLVTSDFALRRLGRIVTGSALLALALVRAAPHWTVAKVALLVLCVPAGVATFAALFVIAGAVQFWLVEGVEFANAFTFGGGYAAGYPASVFALPLRMLFAFVVPAAFVAYLPVLILLDLPGPPGLPAWLGWCAPAAAAAAWLVALLSWRAGLRHYTGAGS
jgi:ABC-2 type transport system permease protein